MTSACLRCSCSRWCSWTPRQRFRPAAMAERWKFSSFMVYGFFSRIHHRIRCMETGCGAAAGCRRSGSNFGLGHGHVDFAGSSVVHMTGGVAGSGRGDGCSGPRIGKYKKDGSADPIPGHSIPMAMIGTFILAFGWFGFNRRIDARRRRLAHRGCRGQHHAGRRPTGALDCDDCTCGLVRSGKPDPSMMVQRYAGGAGRDHRALRIRELRPAACLIGWIAGVLVV